MPQIAICFVVYGYNINLILLYYVMQKPTLLPSKLHIASLKILYLSSFDGRQQCVRRSSNNGGDGCRTHC